MQGCWLAIPTRMKAATMYPDLSGLATTATLDVASIRARLRKLPDAELIRYGQNCAFLCSPKTELRKAAAGNLGRSTQRSAGRMETATPGEVG